MGKERKMAKEEWGTKQTCPKCGTRFYDLGNADPVTCIDCGNEWVPEPILKTKQPIVVEEKAEEEVAEKTDGDSDDIEDIENIDDADDVLGDVSLDDDDDEEVAGIVDTKLTGDEE
jgi:hypothetical protein